MSRAGGAPLPRTGKEYNQDEINRLISTLEARFEDLEGKTRLDYQTYLPVITGSGADPAVTYTTQSGIFTRILGTMIYLDVLLVINTFAGGAGTARISLPTAVGSAQNSILPGSTGGVDWTTSTMIYASPQAGVEYAILNKAITNAAIASITIANIAAGDTIAFTGVYRSLK